MKWFPAKSNIVPIAIVAVLAVAVISGTGLLAPLTQVIGRVTGGVKSKVMALFGLDRRNGNGVTKAA